MSEAFLAAFKKQYDEISRRILAKDDSKALMALAVRLRKELVDATPILTTFDQGQCESQLKSLEQQINGLRESAAPKSRFAFKRTAAPLMKPSGDTTKTLPVVEGSDISAAASSNQLSISTRNHVYLPLSDLDFLDNNRDIPLQSSLSVSDIDSCVVNLLPSTSDSNGASFKITALHIRNLKHSVLIAPVISGSVLIHDCIDSVIVLGCHQFRMHTSKCVDVHLHVSSRPVIEHSSAIRFGAYPAVLPGYNDIANSQHHAIQDFDWIKSTPSPNWSKLTTSLDSSDVLIDSLMSVIDGLPREWTAENVERKRKDLLSTLTSV